MSSSSDLTNDLMAGSQYNGQSIYSILEERYYNLTCPVSAASHTVHTRLYQTAKWSNSESLANKTESVHGSVFNIEFSPVDDLALTVCSNRAILSYDPRLSSSKPIHALRNAHDDAVNCLTFIDHHSFATCSDDKTIRIWDLRQLKYSIAVLQGHQNWVKNIEYDKNSGRLFSVALYDGVREWKMDKMCDYTSEQCDNLVFEIIDPVRMRLSPNGNKMFISERDNKCTVIDHFNGTCLKDIAPIVKDLRDNIYQSGTYKLGCNRPSMYTMSERKGDSSYRSIMSACFFPYGEFIGLRHIDIRNNQFLCENLTLFDLRQDVYKPKYSSKDCQRKYLKYADETSPRESLDIIKEISVSKDGRIIASPFDRGVRLLAIDEQATPPDLFFDDRYHSSYKEQSTLDLHAMQTMTGHKRAVLTCKFANNDLLLATGCLDGHILFHKPRF